MNTKPSRSARLEGVVQVLILLAIGSMAAAASFTHVHNVAAAHGQPGWLAWADAVVLELMSIATGLEIRRRHRSGQPAGFVLWVLIGAVALSMSAQVVEAERSVIGWLAAALPAGGFLSLVKIVLTRTPARTAVPTPAPAVPDTVPAVPATVPDPVPPQDERDGQDDQQDDQDDNRSDTPELLEQARTIATAHRAEHGRPITRDQLRTALGIGTTPATELHRQIKEETTTRPRTVPVPPDAFARVNGTPAGGAQ